MEVCKEVSIGQQVIDREVGLMGLSCGALGAGQSEYDYVQSVAVCSSANIGAFDMNCWVEAVKGGYGEFACLHKSEGGGKAGSYCGVKWVVGVQLAEEHLDEG